MPWAFKFPDSLKTTQHKQHFSRTSGDSSSTIKLPLIASIYCLTGLLEGSPGVVYSKGELNSKFFVEGSLKVFKDIEGGKL